MSDIYSVDYTRALPPPLKNDKSMLALATVIAEQLQITSREIEKNIIYPRIDELDESVLDVLAYDLHVDWYDYTYTLAEKRATIKDSVKVHRKLGTKYAVETALSNIFPGSKVYEWFEYGGDPYKFRVAIGSGSSSVTAEKQAAVLDKIRFYKNLRSHLETLSYLIEHTATVNVVAFTLIGSYIEVYPYLAKTVVTSTQTQVVGFTTTAQTIEIMPQEREGI